MYLQIAPKKSVTVSDHRAWIIYTIRTRTSGRIFWPKYTKNPEGINPDGRTGHTLFWAHPYRLSRTPFSTQKVPSGTTSSHARRIVVPLATFCVSLFSSNRWFWKVPNKHSRKREHFGNIDYKTISDFGHFRILWLPGMVVPKIFFHRFSQTTRSFLCCSYCRKFFPVFQSRK